MNEEKNQKLSRADIELTPAQYLELAKIRTLGLKNNKAGMSIKQRQIQEVKQEESNDDLWDFLEVERYG